jgi:sucrose-6-phosphate hydrolase SacC (GH32 family)
MNDPNGLVYYDGEYHLFYQHNPDDTVWGPMHWGHAVSTDLIHWQHLPIALFPDDVGNIFSGSAVIDWENTAGFGEEAMVAIFTHENSGRQMQSLAYSTDRGRTWTKYAGNPVIQPPNNIRNFRDPKVFWYDGEGASHWVMLVSAGSVILFYTSPDLKTWEPVGGFGPGYGATCGVWETPDLFELPVDGGPETRWVLTVAIGGCAPAGGTGVQYFVGDFDGEKFTSENSKDTVLWVDSGADFYAPQGWNNAPDGRQIWAAWMNNWSYAQDIPTSTWRGALTLPRELGLTKTPDGVRLVQEPVPELEELRDRHRSWEDVTISGESDLLAEVSGETLEIVAEFEASQAMDADRLGLRVRSGKGSYTTIGYVPKQEKLFVDRSHSGDVAFSPSFSAVHVAGLEPIDGRIRLHVFLDRSSLEVLAGDGQVSFSEQIFPDDASLGVEVFSEGGKARLARLDVYELTPESPGQSEGSRLILAAVVLCAGLVVIAGAVYIRHKKRASSALDAPVGQAG